MRGQDYSAEGMYFVTLCTMDRKDLFGKIVDGKMRLNDCGNIADQCWRQIPNHFPCAEIDAFVVMPDHVHGILDFRDGTHRNRKRSRGVACECRGVACECRGVACNAPTGTVFIYRGAACCAPAQGPQSGSLGAVIRSYKSAVSKYVNILRNGPGIPVWQRNYHDRIIRNEHELWNVRRYIHDNPQNWSRDEFHWR